MFIFICSFSHVWWPFWFTSFAWHTNKTSFFVVLIHIAGENRSKSCQNFASILDTRCISFYMWWWFIASFVTLILLFVNWLMRVSTMLQCIHKTIRHMYFLTKIIGVYDLIKCQMCKKIQWNSFKNSHCAKSNKIYGWWIR